MKASPIYNIISIPGRVSDRSFGAVEGFTQDIRVGTSATNSHTLANIQVTREVLPGGEVVFRLRVDGKVIKVGTLDGKEFAVAA